MSNYAVQVEGLCKRYRIGAPQAHYKTLRESLAATASGAFRGVRGLFSANGRQPRASVDDFWALRDVSFSVKHGEVVGIIGRNGAGKSTLLKVLSRITEPTEGSARINGRLGSLLEVGTGFHPELTGRENIYLNGAVLGMRKSEIDRQFEAITAFAEVERFLDTPVKRYSSGMQLRLGFAVAAHLQTEILLVDEVLAVGDAAFQQKCLGKMRDVATGGRTVLFVSHNMPAMLNICDRAVLLSHGMLESDDSTEAVVTAYLRRVGDTKDTSLSDRGDRRGTGSLRFKKYRLCDLELNSVAAVPSGQPVILAFEYEGAETLKQVHIAVGIRGIFDEHLFHLATDTTGLNFPVLPSHGEVLCRLPTIPLQPGSYLFNLFCTVGGDIADWIQHAGKIEVAGGDFFGTGRLPPRPQGPFLVNHSWTSRKL